MKKSENIKFGLCIKNDESEDLEIRKVYQVLPDAKAERDGYVRVIDESGEDYLYPDSFFVFVRLPQRTQRSIAAMAS